MDNKGENLIASGYPKMDPFFENTTIVDTSHWKLSRKGNPHIKRLIWAPHWTVPHPGRGTRFSTFLDYYQKMLEYVKRHPDIEVVLKPHPLLKRECVKRGLLSQSEINDYFTAWNNLPNGSVVEDGNYLDLFKSSDAMILDSISFIAEYAYTDKPALFLCKHKDILSTGFDECGQEAVKTLYEAHSWEDVVHFIDEIVIHGNDTLREQRTRFVNDVLKRIDKPACKYIVDYLEEQLL